MTTQNFGANNTGVKLSCKEIKIERSIDEINRKLSTSQQFNKKVKTCWPRSLQTCRCPGGTEKTKLLARDKCQRYKWCSGTGANIDNNCSAKANRASRSIG
ncbi:putative tumor necrosis factor receptor superfamily member 6 [Trichinella spiralis]|uniref:putative tumor necrosis factor receptor superfamily member 6 n=1 Tax=Trichinella spiralis TaxID=6334 RepID=UPI0001EFC6CB|nr:putative tumor necrosis factor receptor superfamily member 6 [Trichinella spiralis]